MTTITLTYHVPKTLQPVAIQTARLQGVTIVQGELEKRGLSLVSDTVAALADELTRTIVLTPTDPPDFDIQFPTDEAKKSASNQLLKSRLAILLDVSGITEDVTVVTT